ncbi:MAG: OmpA family protein [Candidatus Lambdaproteobacteria bacterium]|nr:OmpA family protein [Candidatus Lambdaproteobacteria bacterium]
MTEEYEESGGRRKKPPPEPPEPEAKPKEDQGVDPDAWMVTFSDLLNLLMTFFVVIFASQDPAEQVLKEAFGQSVGVFGLFRLSFLEKVVVAPRADLSQDRIQVFLDEIGSTEVNVRQEQRGLVITLPADAYFASNQAELTPKAIKRIDQLGAYLKFTRHTIRVEGHTDNEEQGRPRFPTAYELSLARARAVLGELAKAQVPEARMSVAGYGPARPKFTNLSRAGRERNRRVEIIILNRGEFP